MYAQHGALGGADMYAHGVLRARMEYTSPYSPAPAAASSHLGVVERRAVLAELASIHDEAAGLGEHIYRDDFVSLGRSFMDGHGPANDMKMIASHASAKTAHMAAAAAAALTLDDVIEGQFATCRAPTACSQGCSAAVNAAIARCGEWAQSPGALRRTTASAGAVGADALKSSCAAALTVSKQACSEDAAEEARCAAPIIRSYAKFGVQVSGYEDTKLQRSAARVAEKAAVGKKMPAGLGSSYEPDVVFLEDCNPVGLIEFSLYDVCWLDQEIGKVQGWSGAIECAVKGFASKIPFQAVGVPRLKCLKASDGLYEFDLIGKITADHFEAQLPKALRAPANVNISDLLIPKPVPATSQESARVYNYGIRIFRDLQKFGDFGCAADGDGNVGLMTALSYNGARQAAMQSTCTYEFPVYGVTYIYAYLHRNFVESKMDLSAFFHMDSAFDCGDNRVFQKLKLALHRNSWRLQGTCVDIIPDTTLRPYAGYSECFASGGGSMHTSLTNARTMGGQLMKCDQPTHAINAFNVVQCNDVGKPASYHQFMFVCQPLLQAKKNSKVLPYTSGSYSPTTVKALTFNNDLFLGDLKVQIKFHGKVLKLDTEMTEDQSAGAYTRRFWSSKPQQAPTSQLSLRRFCL